MPRSIFNPRPATATPPQVRYLEILFSDCGYNRLQRNDSLSQATGREIRFLDQLTKDEASEAIGILKAKLEEKQSDPTFKRKY